MTEHHDRVLRGAFWTDKRVVTLGAQAKLAFIWLWGKAGHDGIAEIPNTKETTHDWGWDCGSGWLECMRRTLDTLESCGLVAHYQVNGERYAWIPNLPVHQPKTGSLKLQPDNDKPPPPPDKVIAVLKSRLGREPTDKERTDASPRSFGRKGRRGTGIPGGAAQVVFDAWAKRQASPNQVTLDASTRRMINSALQNFQAKALIDFIDYAHTSDAPGPRFWQGFNQDNRKYLGLNNLLVASKLQSRMAEMAGHVRQNGSTDSSEIQGFDPGTDSVAERPRIRKRWGRKRG